MKLEARPLAIAAAVAALLAVVLIGWRLASAPQAGTDTMADAPATSASGVVQRISTPAPAPAPSGNAPLSAASAPPAIINHPVASAKTGQPPILPTEVDAAVDKALGRKTLARYFYLEPLARRFVASVDALGNKNAPTNLWLLKPAPGEIVLAKDPKSPESARVDTTANSRRYDKFVRWATSIDTARLLKLYARMYPLLQQTYVELGHPGAYFNDRLIEVIDQMLAAPVIKGPLRVHVLAAPATIATLPAPATPPRPRYALADPELEALTTGQKIMLRVGPDNAARLKSQLKALRSGLMKLGH